MNSALNSILLLLVLSMSSITMSGQYKAQDKADSDNTSRPYPGIPEKFFAKGDAYISGRIADYSRNLGFDNLTMMYTSPLTGVRTVRTVPIDEDGRFSAIIGMEAPGFIHLDGGNNWISGRYYAEPSRTLYIEFNFEDVQRQCEENPHRFNIAQRVSRFGGDTGEINREISASPLLKEYDINRLGEKSVPRDAADEIKAIFKENSRLMEDFIAPNHLHPLTERILRNELLGQYAGAFGEYEHKRYANMVLKPDVPSLKENPDLSFYDWWKQLLTETDEWLLSSIYMEGSQFNHLVSYFPYLMDAQERYRYYVDGNPVSYLISKGAVLTPEEEEMADWFAANADKNVYYRNNEPNLYHEYLSKVYALAERSGLEQEYKDFRVARFKKRKEGGIGIDGIDLAYNAGLKADAIKRFTGEDEVPLLWQVIQTNILANKSIDDYSEEEMSEILDKIKAMNIITHPVVAEALTEFVKKAYMPKDFELPADGRGKIISEIIEPYKGKFVLLDFWGTSCGLCRIHIEETADERKRLLNHPDYKRIFITSETDSPVEAYNDYVSKNLANETTVRLSDSDYRQVMDLFNFFGLPHYVLIDRSGRVLNPDFDFPHRRSALYDLGVNIYE